jgi:uncharacterized protein (TIGR00299 family) protein
MTAPRHYLKGCKDIAIVINDVIRNGIRSKMVDVQIEEDIGEATASDLLDVTAACLKDLQISGIAKDYALASMNKLVSAEETIHNQSSKEIHLHELASSDTFADIIGTAVALDDLNVLENTSVWSTPVSLGGGTINLAHGTMSCPAPATLEILRNSSFLTIGGPIESELTTPTGAALLTTLAGGSTKFYPSMKPLSVGYGAGSKEFGEIPNVLRVIIGEPADFGLLSDEVLVIETNLDDATGELIGHTINKLLLEGARDVISIPTVNKKGRPGHLISVITDKSDTERLCSLLIEETGSLGVRIYPCERRLLLRESVPVEVILDETSHVVNVKVARGTDSRIIRIKAEFDDIKRLADQTGKTLREIEELVTRKAKDTL